MKDKNGNRVFTRITHNGRLEKFSVTPEQMYKHYRRPWDFKCKDCGEYGNGRGCEGKGGCDDMQGGRDRWYEI